MKIQALKEHELSQLFDYAQLEGWDVEEAHTLALFKTHPNDFFICYKDNMLIGFIVALKESDTFGFISSFLVLKEFRGQGYGKQIFEFALEHLKGCQIALDSVIGKEKFYETYGLKSYFDVYHYRFKVGSVTLPKIPFEITSQIDTELIQKNNYLNVLLQDKTVIYKAIHTNSKLSSYAFSFNYKDGYKITIDSQDINEALALFFDFGGNYEDGSYVYIQVTKLSPILEVIVELLKMEEDSKSVRMYNKILDY